MDIDFHLDLADMVAHAMFLVGVVGQAMVAAVVAEAAVATPYAMAVAESVTAAGVVGVEVGIDVAVAGSAEVSGAADTDSQRTNGWAPRRRSLLRVSKR